MSKSVDTFYEKSRNLCQNVSVENVSLIRIHHRNLVVLAYKGVVFVRVVGDSLKILRRLTWVVLKASKLAAHICVDVLTLLTQHPLPSSLAHNKLRIDDLDVVAVVYDNALVTNTETFLVEVEIHVNFHTLENNHGL
jgi:hypothetical protein